MDMLFGTVGLAAYLVILVGVALYSGAKAKAATGP
jgi:hypothetical protein